MKRGIVFTFQNAVVWSILLLLTGCWDQREIEERTSVVAVGIDKAENNPKLLKVSIQIPIPIKIAGGGGQGGGGGGKEAVKVMSSTGFTMIEAFGNLQKRLNQELFYGHTRVIAIGEAAAKDGLKDITDVFRRDPQLRRLLWPLVVKGEAIDLLKANPQLEQIPTVYTMSLIENGAKIGRIPDMNLGEFYIDLSSKIRAPFLNYIEVTNDDIKWNGLAIFHGDKMIGTLNSDETWEIIRLREKKNGGSISFPYKGDPAQLVSIRMEYIKMKDHYSYVDGRLQARLRVFVEVDLLGKTFESNFSNPEEIKNLETSASTYLESKTKAVITKLQNQYHSDIIGVGSKVKAFHPSIWKKLDWEEDFSKADIQVTYDVKLRRTGMEMEWE